MFDITKLPGAAGFLGIDSMESLVKTLQAGASPGSNLIRQNLSPLIVRITERMTPFADALVARNSQGAGNAKEYRRQIALGSTAPADAFFGENGLPLTDNANYEPVLTGYRCIGKGKDYTEFLREASRSFFGNSGDVESEMTQSALMEFMQVLERAAWYGDFDGSARPYQWDGLLKMIPNANKIDDAEADRSNSVVDLINSAARIIQDKGGNFAPSYGIYLTPGLHQRLNRELTPQGVAILPASGMTSAFTAGLMVGTVQTPLGLMPVKTTNMLTSTACSGPNTGLRKSSLVIVEENGIELSTLLFAEKFNLPVSTFLGEHFVIVAFGAPLWKRTEWCVEVKNVLEG